MKAKTPNTTRSAQVLENGFSPPAKSKPNAIPTNAINDFSDLGGRGEWIRTTGLLVPNQALYQAEPRPEPFQSSSAEVYTQCGAA